LSVVLQRGTHAIEVLAVVVIPGCIVFATADGPCRPLARSLRRSHETRVAADIVRTVALQAARPAIAELGTLVLIRTFLSGIKGEGMSSVIAIESAFARITPPCGMSWVPGGTFLMGSEAFYPEEAPAHVVAVSSFYMDTTAVTNAQYRRFVSATGYVTVAERPLDPALYPDADPELAVPGALVFHKPPRPVSLGDFHNWWRYVPGACWRAPEGPGSTLKGRDDHPVVQVAYEDALAYANWAGKALPTEAEWEYAARGGLHAASYAWGDEFKPDDVHMANTWQGEFPWQNLAADGYEGTAPVMSFPPNGYGLYEMTGNVWEWTSDWYREKHKKPNEHKACCIPTNPRGPSIEHSYDKCMPKVRIGRKVLKGGSYLCAPNYCRRYRPAARYPQMIDTASCHIGFRCVWHERC
jgi:formylglycine-generating enzyme required for sulfatase activity